MKPKERHQHYYNEGYNTGSAKGYEQAIDDAVKWLEKNVCIVYNFDGDENTSTFIEDFRKAMKGGEE